MPDLRSFGRCACGRLYTTLGRGDRPGCTCGQRNGDGYNWEQAEAHGYCEGDEPRVWEMPLHLLDDEEPPF